MEYSIISHLEPQNYVTEMYRQLRTNIEFLSIENNYQVLNITSSTAEEGKTVALLNLATVLAQNNKKVIVLDLDLRKPKVHRAFNEVNGVGITNILMKENITGDYVQHHEGGFDAIFSGAKTTFPSEMLGSKRLTILIQALKEKYDYILLDGPPMNIVTDSSIISSFSDATLMAIKYNSVDRKLAQKTIQSLIEANANIIGTVITQADKNLNKKYGYYYE